jgi:hypothetical protein
MSGYYLVAEACELAMFCENLNLTLKRDNYIN